MDEILAELIKALQWPRETDMISLPEKPLRRPSPYWIQKQVQEKLKKESPTGKAPGGIESRWKKLESIVEIQLTLNLKDFGYNRSLVSFGNGEISTKRIMSAIKEFNFVEKAHTSMILGDHGNMEPMLSTEIIYESEKDHRKKLSLLEGALPWLTEISLFHGKSLFNDIDASALKRVINGDQSPRARSKKIIRKLLENPLMKLPQLASETGMSWSEVKKYFSDLVHGGVLLFEPAIDTRALTGSTLGIIMLYGEEKELEESYRKVMNSDEISRKILNTRNYYSNVKPLLCMISSYYDLMDLYREIVGLGLESEIKVAWQFRSIPVKTVRYPFLYQDV